MALKDRAVPEISPEIEAVLSRLGHRQPFSPEVAGSAGSGRVYWRIQTDALSHILLQSHPGDVDYDRFLTITRHLRDSGLRVPDVHGSDDRARQVVLEDLGSVLLLAQAKEAGFPGQGDRPALRKTYQPALWALEEWQRTGTRHMARCPVLCDRVFDLGPLLWESSYFARRCAEESFGLPPERLAEPALLSELGRLALRVEGHRRVLMHRDFQSQNLMSRPDGIWFIDYQGARQGSCWYDLASLLWDPYVGLPMELRRELFEDFLSMRSMTEDTEKAWQDVLDAALQRVMQALGAYGFLSRHKGLPWFAGFLRPGIEILCQTVAERGGMPALALLADELRHRETLPVPGA